MSSPATFQYSLVENCKTTLATNLEAVFDPKICRNNNSATPTPAVSKCAGSNDKVSESKYSSRSLQSMQRDQYANKIRSHFTRDKK
ncbi:11657_t:CDS:2 [Dentiscutata erythropus]|uniref:11657_t:CDS:1 n=1 Tax=Dentiscutata erythropus TaxID=1348616 RepID=A0A9N9NCM0_9GLOM|nr:11657_t:CDS:2 [Dentiscutata erythropus]